MSSGRSALLWRFWCSRSSYFPAWVECINPSGFSRTSTFGWLSPALSSKPVPWLPGRCSPRRSSLQEFCFAGGSCRSTCRPWRSATSCRAVPPSAPPSCTASLLEDRYGLPMPASPSPCRALARPCGAQRHLLGCPGPDLLDTIRRAGAGQSLLDPALTQRVLDRLQEGQMDSTRT